MMYQKQKRLAMGNENASKMYIFEAKIVSLSSLARVMKKRGIEK
jgi:hypothetical protein